MDQIKFTRFLLLLSLSAAYGKYVYVPQWVSWSEAQNYCRLFHTDLAPVNDRQDTDRLQKLAGDSENFLWTGMERSSTNGGKWIWSGGKEVSTFFWAPGQPDNRPSEDYGVIQMYGWHDAVPSYRLPFFCYSAVVVRQRKTWEEALAHCREHHSDLASVASETEMLLIRRQLDKLGSTDHVWIGLHFFPGGWQWVDGRPLDYEAWGQGNKPACPQFHLGCAAVQVTGRGQIISSADLTLAVNATEGMGSVGNTATNIGLDTSGAAGVWEAHDCEEKLHFICY
ncbi:C-type mannose receptor 2-like [Scophthalmus maximus]|uniref:C-type mannose receptor 2-like n=1 Tax=Scophthalmus maximus TaxID=52904 RepID=UPI001FA93A9F|nr:C-type mannose receptor 2-like [Scophthalmus maximus]